jgi:hypothetical protein
MKLRIFLLLLFALGVGDGARASHGCPSFKLDEPARARLEAAAAKVSTHPIDPLTLDRCRGPDFLYAKYYTVFVAQPDGSDAWDSVSCASPRRGPESWRCIVERNRVVRVSPKRGDATVVVRLSDSMKAADARAWAPFALDLLATSSGTAATCGEPGKRESFRNLRRELASFRSVYVIKPTADGFMLTRGNLYFTFTALPGSGSPQFRCWSEDVIVVTS